MRPVVEDGKIHSLVNRNGGFEFITKSEYDAWVADPAEACRNFPDLLSRLHVQTHNRGFDYEDFTPTVQVV